MSVRGRAIKRHLRRIAKRAVRRMKIRKIVKRGKHVKGINFAKPHWGSIMLA